MNIRLTEDEEGDGVRKGKRPRRDGGAGSLMSDGLRVFASLHSMGSAISQPCLPSHLRKSRSLERSTKEHKGRTDSNSPTGPNEAVRVATVLL